MSSTVPVADVIAALKIVSTYNLKGAIAAFESKDELAQADTVLMTVEDVAKIIGLFIPVAAQVGMWIEVARFLLPLAVELSSHLPPPHVLEAGEYEAWGHTFKR